MSNNADVELCITKEEAPTPTPAAPKKTVTKRSEYIPSKNDDAEKLWQKLEQRAESEGKSIGQVVQDAINSYIP